MDQQQPTTFPVLKNAMILQCMEEIAIPLTEGELTEPGRHKERIREVFIQLLCFCWGLNETTLAHIPQRIRDKQSALDHPELHEDALAEGKFFCLLSKLFRTCGYYEFGFKDLQAPQAKKLKRQLSALINFMKYREDMNHLLDAVLSEREEVFTALDEVTEDNRTLEEHLELARSVNQEKMLEQEEAEAECKEMEMELAQQNKIQASIRQETLLLKKSANELKDQIANLSIALRELQSEERQLSTKVVHSPDRTKFELAEATKKLEDVKKMIAEKESERKVVQKETEHVLQGENCLVDVMKAMDETEKKVREYETVVGELDDVQSRLEAAESNHDEKRKQMEKQKKELETIERRKIETTTNLKKELENAQTELNAAVNELGVIEGERLDGIARIEESQKKVQELEIQIKNERKNTDEWIASRIAAFHKFEKAYRMKEAPFASIICE